MKPTTEMIELAKQFYDAGIEVPIEIGIVSITPAKYPIPDADWMWEWLYQHSPEWHTEICTCKPAGRMYIKEVAGIDKDDYSISLKNGLTTALMRACLKVKGE